MLDALNYLEMQNNLRKAMNEIFFFLIRNVKYFIKRCERVKKKKSISNEK